MRESCRTTEQAGQERAKLPLMEKRPAAKPMTSLPQVGGNTPLLRGVTDLPGLDQVSEV